jgi:RNA polymerase sigma factor (sigma-70 family)
MPPPPHDAGEKLFLENLETIEKVIRFACASAQLRDAEAEDFASHVRIKLIENDYAILRKLEQRASFAGYINTVVHRLRLDYQIGMWGKWHSSAEAKRLGPVAVLLEKIINRDGRTITEALPICQTLDAGVTLEPLEALAARLPARQARPRPVELDSVAGELRVPPDSLRNAALRNERALSHDVGKIIRDAQTEWSEEDRRLVRLHFGARMSVAQIARVMHIDQKPLYRKLKRCLKDLKRRLQKAGIDRKTISDIMERDDLDFGFDEESQFSRPSVSIDAFGRDRGGSR